MRVAGIGDNCIDIYEKLGKKYPTGNVVDTIINLQKLGIAASIISTIGNDSHGKWMQRTLQSERVDISHLKVKEGKTAITYMDIEENERIHGNYVEGVVEHILFDKEDIAFAVSHDLVHTALWGRAEGTLPAIAAAGVPISFDYGDRLVYGILHGFSIEECLKKGAAIAASVVAVFEPWVKENKRCL